MKKTIFLLNIENYSSEITKITYPLIKYYANKINSELVFIKERKYTDYPVTYEKLQIYDLAKEYPSDWYIYFDSDVLIHPEFFDLTHYISKKEVLIPGNNISSMRFNYDNYFLRDGRNVGVPNWFSIVSDWCLDFWKPPADLTLEQIKNNLFPIPREKNYNTLHRIDDYIVSRNISKYGLKFTTLNDVYLNIFGHVNLDYIEHFEGQDKLELINKKYNEWM